MTERCLTCGAIGGVEGCCQVSSYFFDIFRPFIDDSIFATPVPSDSPKDNGTDAPAEL